MCMYIYVHIYIYICIAPVFHTAVQDLGGSDSRLTLSMRDEIPGCRGIPWRSYLNRSQEGNYRYGNRPCRDAWAPRCCVTPFVCMSVSSAPARLPRLGSPVCPRRRTRPAYPRATRTRLVGL